MMLKLTGVVGMYIDRRTLANKLPVDEMEMFVA